MIDARYKLDAVPDGPLVGAGDGAGVSLVDGAVVEDDADMVRLSSDY